jgi:hypothetical protein
MRQSPATVGADRESQVMTVQQLRSPVMATEIAAARSAFDRVTEISVGSLQRDELPEVLSELAILESRVAALKLDVLAEADRRQIADQTGDTGTDAWAAKLTGTTRGVMSGGIWLANLLRSKYDATREAFAAGGINQAQVRVIVRAAEDLPAACTHEQRVAAEAGLVEKAVKGMNPRRLRQAARRMLEDINRDLADEHEAGQLKKEEGNAENETWMQLSDNGDGTFSGRFTIPELHGHLLRNYLEKLTAPRRLSRNKAGDLVHDDTLPGGGPSLSRTEQLGAGFLELLEHLPTDGHGPVGATLLINLDFENLLNGLASAKIDTGVRISAGEARRLACGAGIVPVVLGGDSEPLDLGRERRLHTKAQRRALSIRHDSCASEGCERPFAWTEIHHPHSWSDGGTTSLENALPLCGFHHRRAHDDRFTMRRLPSGEVRFRRRT